MYSGQVKLGLLALYTTATCWSLQSTPGSTSVISSPAAAITESAGGSSKPLHPENVLPAYSDEGAHLIPNVRDPLAIDAQDVCPGYKASHVEENGHGVTAVLTLAGKPCNVYGNEVPVLKLKVEFQAASRLAINISPAYISPSNASYYILPEELVPRPKSESSYKELGLEFNWGNNPSFWFSVTRKSTGDVLFTTKNKKLIYEDQFIEFVSDLPEDYNLSGLGERIHALRLNNHLTATIYNADVADPIDGNIYGSHPFYLETRYFETDSDGKKKIVTKDAPYKTGKNESSYESYSHGVFLRNSHGQEVQLRPKGLTWRLLGGSIDLFFFEGPTAADVTKQYHISAVGLPAMQSYWTLGFHQCRWGYQSWEEAREVVDNFKAFNIPLESLWLDIDYMDQYRDFTLDPHAFSPSHAKKFFDKLHGDGQHFVPIVDGAIYIPDRRDVDDPYDVYHRGNKSHAFLKNPDGSQYIGAVWPGYTVFPDWQSKGAQSWWIEEMVEWRKTVKYDGFWVDMTEVASFCVGSCGSGEVHANLKRPAFSLPGDEGNRLYDFPEGFNITNATEAEAALVASSAQAALKPAKVTPANNDYLRTTPTPGQRNVNHPPYVINHIHGDLARHAVSPNATHENGVQEYDVHNLWGHQIINATYHGLKKVLPGKRPFIIGRSTFAGSGKYAGHWGGDNASKWYYMYFSIPQALSFSLFGIPMFGVDTCGFGDNTSMELCARWMQLSAFFPFYRNHNTRGALSQEPYRWETVASASRTAMQIRYSLLPYLYTLFHQAHTTGSTVMRALAWEFPNEPQLAGVDNQFLLGPSLLITPVLEPQVSSVRGVFPGVGEGQVWYDWYTHEKINVQAGENKSIAAPLGHIPVFVRGGSVLPLQEPGYTTGESRKNPWGLIIALSGEGEARGDLYVDDGESIEPSAVLEVGFRVAEEVLKAEVKGGYTDTNALGNVTILGVRKVGEVRLDGKRVESAKVRFDKESGVLRLVGLNEETRGGAWKRSWTLSWK
ncbi:glycosyl hydrolases family 31-domain-containing protein [Dendryphion nanum]|uniref:alpha-glucosidase n=1 Tax=Dendryphion nanum TaxID=256645 RepID=A0A9P9J1H2_9PLEO|nr:glycosyl hydrolases family 31-domain-containing protein [Dendryphion nanum]